MPLRRSRAPLWFECLVALALALALRALGAALAPGGAAPDLAPPPAFAFWALIGMLAQAIWKGIEVAGRVTLEVLKWSVVQLWAFAKKTFDVVSGVGKDLFRAARRAWDFLEATYKHVIKPAWEKFWQWYDRARAWLEKVVKPVFKFLRALRTELLKYYTKWVRPILDSIDIARRVLGIFKALGFDWARSLDGVLADLQRRIDAPFRALLAQINQVINWVNRIATLDGLLQRVALVRSIERDIRQVSRAIANWRSKPVTEAQWARIQKLSTRTDEEIWLEFTNTVEPGPHTRDPHTVEIAAQWRAAIRR